MPILLFDGHCNFCNAWVRLIVRRNTAKNILFAPLQSSVGRKMLEEHKIDVNYTESLVFFEEERYSVSSTAALRIYSYSYSNRKKSKEGLSGVLTEQFLIWVSESDFIKAARAEKATMYIGGYAFELSSEGRDAWQIMMDKERLLKIMDEEQQREYGQYPHENKEKKELDLRKKRMVSEAEESTWKMIENSDNPEDFRYFLEQFPDSPYAIPAKLKLKQLERESQ